MKKIRVLSLFDGISCARVALDRLGYEVEYYASEVDKYAIAVSQRNWPDAVQLGDVRGITADMFPDGIDLLIGGSPCQDLSIAKAGRKGLDGERSGLFWEYVRIWRELKPRYFVLENVNSMPKDAKRIISETFGVEPIMINAALVSAQNRKRLFWTNICADVLGNQTMPLPEDRGILLRDILESGEGITGKSYTGAAQIGRHLVDGKRKDIVGAPTEQRVELRADGKANCVSTVTKDSLVAEKSHPVEASYHKAATSEAGVKYSLETGQRTLVVDNESKSYAIPSTYYKENLKSLKQRKKKGLMVTEPVRIGEIGSSAQGYRVYSEDGKSVTLPALSGGQGSNTGLYQMGENYTIRKLTPVECERLQSLPDGYTEGISNTQRYKCLGNAFNVEVVRHILSFMDGLIHPDGEDQ